MITLDELFIQNKLVLILENYKTKKIRQLVCANMIQNNAEIVAIVKIYFWYSLASGEPSGADQTDGPGLARELVSPCFHAINTRGTMGMSAAS